MTDKTPVSKKGISADWFMQGALTKIGDTLDRLTGRKWIPSSSLATSELIEKMKGLLDAEAKDIPGKGIVVPHNIKLKMQWDKFSTDADQSLKKLENELLAAAADHINDMLYYTYAPLRIEVKPDYFTEGVKLFVSFDKFSDEEHVAETNVTIPAINVIHPAPAAPEPKAAVEIFIARFELKGSRKDKRLEFPARHRLSVGRTGGNDLAIDDMSVSKIHASLIADSEGQLSVADTGSTNGTFVNNQRISYGKAVRLIEGDVVKFGVVAVLFDHVPPPVEAEPQIPSSELPDQKTTAIDGFEFTSRVSSEPADEPEPLPDETLKIETLKAGADKGKTEPGK
ncbi:MAG: FHA domain-containing protein [Pyrinomonadaceae bacterium]